MKLFSGLALPVVALLSVACGAVDPSQELQGDEGTEEELGSSEQALCANQAGTKAVLASLAVATAVEMRRWNAPVDFRWNTSTAMLEVSPTGAARCNGNCRNVNALLGLQKNEANLQVAFPGGVLLDVYALRGAMKHYFDQQTRCNSSLGEYATNGCSVEAHDLRFWKTAPGTCAADNYFWASKARTSNSLDAPARLNFQLMFVGYPDNDYLNFRNNSSNVVIDPTVGLTEANTTTSGSCTAACTQYSTTSKVGQCCTCNGVTKSFSRSPFSYDMYLCK